MLFREQVGSSGVRTVLRLGVFLFLGLNLWYRFSSVFDYSRFVGGLFIFLGICSLVVVLFPKILRVFLFLFGASFFLFGFRAYDIQSQVFETVVVFVALVVFLVNMRGAGRGGQGTEGGRRRTEGGGSGVNRQLLGLMGCYIGLSVLSLLLLPVVHIVKDFWLFGLKTSLMQMANATPNTYLYPLAGINRLILFFVLAYGLATGVKPREQYRPLFVGLFVGAVFCAFLGLLDFYGIVSLNWYRTANTPGVLHSTFLNRGWFAEFVLTLVPFVLLGFMSRIKGIWWKIALFSSLIICELALILAGARAGWVSYPLILFICWLFSYFSKEGRFESFHFGWKDLIKVAVSVPITIGISFLLIFQVLMPLSDYLGQETGIKGVQANSKASTAYLQGRASSILKASKGGRYYTWGEGLNVGRERPIFGMGYESFNWHANILADMPESYFHRFYTEAKINKIHDTPHSIFYQLFVSGGIVGLCLWMMIVFYAIVLLLVDGVKHKRLINIPVVISIISFHIYGIFQSMQYIPMIWSLIFLNLGYAMTIDEKVFKEKTRRGFGALVKVCAVVVMIGAFVYLFDFGSKSLATKYGLKAYARDQSSADYFGFYSPEKWKKGTYRWSGRRALVELTNEGLVKFDFDCRTPDVEKRPVVLTITEDGRSLGSVIFTSMGTIEKYFYLVNKNGEGDHKLLFEVSRTWNPQRLGVSDDVRHLGVAVSEPEFPTLFPVEGIGFYDWETWRGSAIPGWTGDEMKFRWMGTQAFIPIDLPSKIASVRKHERESELEDQTKGGLQVFLRSAHPDIGADSVVVEIYRDKMLWKEIVLKNKRWKKIVFDPNEIKDSKVLGFKVSRTWNPSLLGISEDRRDLGVAVVLVADDRGRRTEGE